MKKLFLALTIILGLSFFVILSGCGDRTRHNCEQKPASVKCP
jgi:uncharacterized lipoprotein YehR (DUF1307 family)